MNKIKGYRACIFILIFYVIGVFATVYIARLFTVSYYFGIGNFDFLKEAARAGEIGVKIGGLVALISCVGVVFEKWRAKR